MKPQLKAFDCVDHDPIESWSPATTIQVDYWLCLHIGLEESEGADLFYVNILSEKTAQTLSEKEFARRKTIVVEPYSWAAVVAALERILRSVEGADWVTMAEQLRTKFDWEFENYRPTGQGV